jgi:hypothetical protein
LLGQVGTAIFPQQGGDLPIAFEMGGGEFH